jgi:ligand-binding SRPBCC domain-containing protein
MTHVFKRVQTLPVDGATAWAFFSNPKNLNAITPKELNFNILSELPNSIYPGLMIAYKLKMFGWMPLDWLTEITHVHEPFFFVDEQRVGPYAIWHHEHHFKPVQGGLEMTDIVHYRLFADVFGLLNTQLVRPQLEKIFLFRKSVLESQPQLLLKATN